MTAGDQFFLKPGSGDSIELVSDLLLGRSDDCDLVLTQGHPSRRHAQLSVSAEGVSIEDLGSANGSFLNGERLSTKKLLKNGDVLRFDIAEYQFVVRSEAALSESGDQTVIRSVEDLQKTTMRPVEELMAEAAADKAPAPEIAPGDSREPAVEEVPVAVNAPVSDKAPSVQKESPVRNVSAESSSGSSAAKPAGSWVANPTPGEGTQLFSREQLAEMAAQLSGGQDDPANNSAIPCLRIASGASEGSEIQLTSGAGGGEWTIGCDDSRDIILKDEGVSAFHAKITNNGKRWKLVDQMSANGTFVNEKKALASFLNSGDHIRVGTVECIFFLPGSKDARSGSGGVSEQQSAGGSNMMKGLIALVAGFGLLVVLCLLFE